MTIQEIHERILFRLNKEAGGYISSEDIDRALDTAQLQELNFLLGNEREYQPDRPIARSAYGKNRKIHHDLLHLKKEFAFNTNSYSLSDEAGTGPDGIIILPSDVLYVTGLMDSSYKYIELVNEDQLPQILDSELIGPSSTNRYAILSGKSGMYNAVAFATYKIQCFPEEAIAGTLYYLKRPRTPVYSYTMSGRNRVYNANGSSQLDWPDHVIERIITRTLALLGQHLKEGEVVQINESKNQIGI